MKRGIGFCFWAFGLCSSLLLLSSVSLCWSFGCGFTVLTSSQWSFVFPICPFGVWDWAEMITASDGLGYFGATMLSFSACLFGQSMWIWIVLLQLFPLEGWWACSDARLSWNFGMIFSYCRHRLLLAVMKLWSLQCCIFWWEISSNPCFLLLPLPVSDSSFLIPLSP